VYPGSNSRPLVESVRKKGVMEPVEILSEEDAPGWKETGNAGKLLGGRQRVRAAKACGLGEVPAVHAVLPEGMSPMEYILRRAMERRQPNKR